VQPATGRQISGIANVLDSHSPDAWLPPHAASNGKLKMTSRNSFISCLPAHEQFPEVHSTSSEATHLDEVLVIAYQLSQKTMTYYSTCLTLTTVRIQQR